MRRHLGTTACAYSLTPPPPHEHTHATGHTLSDLDGTDGGRVHTSDGDHLYGLFQWDVTPSAAVGAVSGAYVSAPHLHRWRLQEQGAPYVCNS